jgi:hypothetical protein
MPVVLMVLATDLSLAILILPWPAAVVVTGGVSSAPVKLTSTSFANAAVEPKTRAVAASNMWTLRGTSRITPAVMVESICGGRQHIACGLYCETIFIRGCSVSVDWRLSGRPPNAAAEPVAPSPPPARSLMRVILRGFTGASAWTIWAWQPHTTPLRSAKQTTQCPIKGIASGVVMNSSAGGVLVLAGALMNLDAEVDSSEIGR